MGKARTVVMRRMRTTAVAVVILWLLHPHPASAMVKHLTFDEVVASAELIFHGQVIHQECRFAPGEKMIFTDVTFAVHELISHRRDSKPLVANTVVLSLAGGRIGEKRVWVSDVPSFVTGEDYVIFTRWDGVQYASPVIGSTQGVFGVTMDEETGKAYPLGPGRRFITGTNGNSLSYGSKAPGTHTTKAVSSNAFRPDIFFDVAPQPAGRSKGSAARATIAARPATSTAVPITLEKFLREVRKTLSVQRRGGNS